MAVKLKSQNIKNRFNSWTTKTLSLDSIVDAAMTLNSFTGDDSVQKKIDMMAELCKSCHSDDELRFLVRSFANTGLRIGLSTKSVEKCIISYFQNLEESDGQRTEDRLCDFERNIFGYRIQSLSAEG